MIIKYASLAEMKKHSPLFFKNGRGLGERYNVRKNHLIISRPMEIPYDDYIYEVVIFLFDIENYPYCMRYKHRILANSEKAHDLLRQAKNWVDGQV